MFANVSVTLERCRTRGNDQAATRINDGANGAADGSLECDSTGRLQSGSTHWTIEIDHHCSEPEAFARFRC